MGQLARYLQGQFVERTPRGWTCAVEARVLDGGFERLLGYAPQADVLLASNDGRQSPGDLLRKIASDRPAVGCWPDELH